MDIKLSEQVGNVENIRENFKKIKKAILAGTSLPEQPGNSGKFLTTDGTNVSWVTVSAGGAVDSVFGRTGVVIAASNDYSFTQISGSVADAQLSANATLQGNTFNGNAQLVQLTAAGKYPAVDGSLITNLPGGLPSQTGNAGKFLATDGTVASWGTSPGWGSTGNAGTTAGTNFLGTTDAQDLIFKVNNSQSGLISQLDSANTALGYQALINNVPNLSNFAGYSNIAIGYQALTNNHGLSTDITGSGSFNIAIGKQALYYNTKGSGNTAIGQNAMFNNTTGTSAVSIGHESMSNGTTLSNSVAIGYRALRDNNNQNTAVGCEALLANSSGGGNVAVGFQSLMNSNGNYNLAIGDQALYSQTSGYQNVAVGHQAGYGKTNGGENCIVGWGAGYGNSNQTTCIGNRTVSGGNYQVALGYNAGGSSGNNSVYIGAFAGVAETASNKLYINSTAAAATSHLLHGDFSTGQIQINSAATPALEVSAAFHIISTTKGFLPPRMTTTQINAIATPAEALMIYDLTLHKYKFWNGSAYEIFTSA